NKCEVKYQNHERYVALVLRDSQQSVVQTAKLCIGAKVFQLKGRESLPTIKT
ncbi:hypothetical protein OC861_006124, partial [Tilletia horrida]